MRGGNLYEYESRSLRNFENNMSENRQGVDKSTKGKVLPDATNTWIRKVNQKHPYVRGGEASGAGFGLRG